MSGLSSILIRWSLGSCKGNEIQLSSFMAFYALKKFILQNNTAFLLSRLVYVFSVLAQQAPVELY